MAPKCIQLPLDHTMSLVLKTWSTDVISDHILPNSIPREFISKLIYLVVTNDERIQKVDTVSVSCFVMSEIRSG